MADLMAINRIRKRSFKGFDVGEVDGVLMIL